MPVYLFNYLFCPLLSVTLTQTETLNACPAQSLLKRFKHTVGPVSV